MYSQFFNGFLVLVFPDTIFEKTIKEESAFEPLVSMLFSSAVFTTLGINILKRATTLEVNILLPQALLLILSLFFLFIIITAAVSGFLDWIISAMITIKNRKIDSDFLGSFCSHAYVIPFWIFVLFVQIVLREFQHSLLLFIFSIVFILRFIDIEARLIKAVYKLRLIQGYLLVFTQLILLWIGLAIGFFVRHTGILSR